MNNKSIINMMIFHAKRLFLLFVLGLTFAANSFAEANWYTDPSNNLYYLIDTDNNTATLYANKDNSYTGDINIPEEVTFEGKSYPVVALADECFKSCQIGKVTIPKSVKKLGNKCFESSTLSSITILNSVTELGTYCFSGCSSLLSITIPTSITELPDYCFSSSNLSQGVSLPNSLQKLGNSCFGSCKVTNIELPLSITEIGVKCFSYCKDLTCIKFPNNLKKISYECLAYCNKLQEVTLPTGLEVIEAGSFYNCSSLEQISIPNSVKEMNCQYHMSYIINQEGIFEECSNLKQITIPPLVTSLGHNMFWGCSSLATVTIGSGVNKIEYRAFASCKKINKINCYAEEVPTIEFMKGDDSTIKDPFGYYGGIDLKNCILNVPTGSKSKYEEAEYWKNFGKISSLGTPEPGVKVLAASITDTESDIPEGTYYAGNLVYTRKGNNIAPEKYASLCLPFDINLAETDCFSSVFIPINMALYNTKAKSLTMMLDKAEMSSVIKAGQPFLAKLKSDKIELKNCNSTYISSNYADQKIETTFKVYDTTGESGVLQQNQDLDVRFGGTYQRMEGLDKTVYKTFYTDGRLYNGEVVTPFRAYLYKANATAQAAVQSITWGVGDETTGIKYIVTPEPKLTSNKVFTLDGKLVNQTGDTKSLKKGIYIINGRKIIIK